MGFDFYVAEQIGWTLLHFSWQAAFLAVAFAVARAALTKGSANIRYICAGTTLVLMAAAPLLTFWFYSQSFDAHGPLDLAASTPQVPLVPLSPLRPLLGWIVNGWVAGVASLLILRLGGLVFLRWSLRLDKTPLNDARFIALKQRLGIRRKVRFLNSAVLQAPATLGTLRPIVLVPAGALAGLNPLYLDALIVHELAHIRRHDFLINLLQTVLETLFFFHPAVWWVSNQVRIERENCCDDLAVSACGNEHLYAEALVAMEDLRERLPAYALGARGGKLLSRINRLLLPRASRLSRVSSTAVFGGVCSMIAVVLLLNQLLIGAVAERVRGPADLPSLSTTVAQVLGSYKSDMSSSFPELRDAIDALETESAELPAKLDSLVKALNDNPRPDFISRQIVQTINLDDPDRYNLPAGNYGSYRQRQQLAARLHERAKAMRSVDPDGAARYARATLILVSQEEVLSQPWAARRLVADAVFMAITKLSPAQVHRIRRALAEHERVTSLAQRLEQQTLNKLALRSRLLEQESNPQPQLDALVALAQRRFDLQWRVVTLYQRWLAAADDRSRESALSAAQAWRLAIPGATFANWLERAEVSSLQAASDHSFSRPTKNLSGSITPVERPLVVK